MCNTGILACKFGGVGLVCVFVLVDCHFLFVWGWGALEEGVFLLFIFFNVFYFSLKTFWLI